jgi:MFS family permease
MRQSARREYVTLAALSASGGMTFLIPLYLHHLGYPVSVVGLLAGLAALATLLSRIPVPLLYRPQRARTLLLATAAGGLVSTAILPWLPNLTLFTVVLLGSCAMSGVATTVFLARYLDLLGEETDRRRAMGNYGGTQALGYTASNVFIGTLADFLGFPAAFMFGAMMFGVAGLLLINAPNPPAKAAAPRGLARPRTRGGLRGYLAAIADPGLWLVLNANSWNQCLHILQASFIPVLATTVGLGAAQVGIVRAIYSAVNAVGRPAAGIVMGRLALRHVGYLGLAIQASPLFLLPFAQDVLPFVVVSLMAGFGRAVVVVAASAGLAEEVDETRVSRGLATSAYSTSMDVPNVVWPLGVGLVASVVGLGFAFPIAAMAVLGGYTAGDLAVAQWRARRGPRPVPAAATPAGVRG